MSKIERLTKQHVDKLFHISFQSNLAGIWRPKLPTGMTKEQGLYPEPIIERISFAPTIEQCFMGVYPNIKHLFRTNKHPYMFFQVYGPVVKGNERMLSNQTLINERLVWDAHVTGEVAVLDPIEMKWLGEVKIKNPLKNKDLLTHPFGDINLPPLSVGPEAIEYSWSQRCP